MADPKIRSALRTMIKYGIYARGNFMCCRTCASSEINNIISRRKMVVKGVTFWTHQDEEDRKQTGRFYLSFSEHTGSSCSTKEIGEEICGILRDSGVSFKWDGNPAERILIIENSIQEADFKKDTDEGKVSARYEGDPQENDIVSDKNQPEGDDEDDDEDDDEGDNKEYKDGKPTVKLVGEDGNIFNLIAITSKYLPKDKAKEMQEKVFTSGSYDNALCTIMEYVNIV